MKKPILFLLLFGLILGGCIDKKQKTLRIATAANLQFAIKKLTVAFTAKTGIPSEAIIGSSGKLTAQIEKGAPYDVFISADMKYLLLLQQKGRARTKPQILNYGKLILWSRQANLSLDSLANTSIKHIAIANPKVAPFGMAAEAVLRNFGIFESLKKKLVYGESIAQVNQFVHTGVADVGFTALSVVRALPEKEKGYWMEIDKTLYAPISQGIILLENDRKLKEEAQQFYDFLFSVEGRQILEAEGYSMKE